ncbi:MAG: right-handed parallel beta-helix repeat-containing protein [Promethearchaeota archaeon]
MQKKVLFLLVITIGLGSFGSYSLVSTIFEKNDSDPPFPGLVEITSMIHIDNNWSATNSTYSWCSGAGTEADPYVIENLFINCHGLRTGIFINRTTEFFMIKNCTVFNSEGNGSAIWLQFVDNGEISGNTIVNNQGGGIYLYYDCNYNTIRGNKVSRNVNGIYISASTGNIITGNNVHDNRGRGIWLMKSSSNEVFGNRIKENWVGLAISNSNNSLFSANFISIQRDGVSLVNSHANVIIQNDFQLNLNGITLADSTNNSISENAFTWNVRMKKDSGSVSGNVFYKNSIEGLLHGYTSAFLFLTGFIILGVILSIQWKKRARAP